MILFLPKWYPSHSDPQLGVFVQKHARAAATGQRIVLLYVQGMHHLSSSREWDDTDNQGVREVIVYFRKAVGSCARILNGLRYIRCFCHGLRKILKTEGRPAIIHAHVFLRPVLAAYLLSRYYRIPYVITEHWTGYIYGAYSAKSKIYKWLCEYVLHRAQALTLVSVALQDAMAVEGLTHPHTLLIPNVIDIDPISRSTIRTGGVLRILTVADLVDRNKNISGALRAVSLLHAEGISLEYHIVGGGVDEAALSALARKLDPDVAWVRLHGRRDNEWVLDFMREVDFLLTNSNIETFSVATAEAIALGKPVVATRCGGPEFFVNEGNGILIEPGNEKQLLQALRSMAAGFQNYDPLRLSSEILAIYGPHAAGTMLSELYNESLQS